MIRRPLSWLAVGVTLALASPLALADEVAPPPLPADQPTPPPLPPPEPDAQFYAAENGQPVGPLSLEQLKARIQNGQTKRSDLVWKAGTPTWVKAGELAELKDAFGAAPPDMPAAAQWERYIVGTWESSGTSPQGYDWRLRIQYTADGKYGGYQVLTMNGLESQQAIGGKWTVTPAGENKFSLVHTPQNGIPSTSILTVIDEYTVANESDGTYAKKVGR